MNPEVIEENDDAAHTELNNSAREVKTEDDFRNFVLELLENFNSTPGSWNNSCLEAFLDALISCVPYVEDYYENHGMLVTEQPTWSHFAHILLAAKTYGSSAFEEWVGTDQI